MIKKVHAEERVGQKGECDELNRNEGKRPNKNLIFHGMVEDRKVEDLTKVQDVANDIGIMLHRWDVDKTSRIGAYEKGRKGPVKVELVSEITKQDFLKSKKKLKESDKRDKACESNTTTSRLPGCKRRGSSMEKA